MRITFDETRRIAALAQLDLDEAAVEKFAADLSKILDYIDQLKEVDVSGVPGVIEQSSAFLADDVVRPSLPLEAIEANAPRFAHGHFVVPKIIGGET